MRREIEREDGTSHRTQSYPHLDKILSHTPEKSWTKHPLYPPESRRQSTDSAE